MGSWSEAPISQSLLILYVAQEKDLWLLNASLSISLLLK